MGTPSPARVPIRKPVTVTITKPIAGGPLNVHPQTVVVSKQANEEVAWECPSGEDFEVSFDLESPFPLRSYSQANPKSGGAVVGYDSGKRYKYTVTVGTESVDPDVIVDQ